MNYLVLSAKPRWSPAEYLCSVCAMLHGHCRSFVHSLSSVLRFLRFCIYLRFRVLLSGSLSHFTPLRAL